MKSKKDIMSRYPAVFNVIKPAIEAEIGLIVGKDVSKTTLTMDPET